MIYLVLLAAGQGARFGDIKQLAPIYVDAKVNTEHKLTSTDTQLINVQLQKFSSLATPIVLILGYQQQLIKNAIKAEYKQHITCVNNNSWQSGLSSSIQCAVTTVRNLIKRNNQEDSQSALLFVPLDLPCLQASDLQKLIDQYQTSPTQICCSEYQNQIGSPAIIPERYWPQLLELKGDQGALKLIKNQAHYQKVALPNAAYDIDTQAQLKAMQAINFHIES
ncbi:nucleotidyltransferase family protein [Catenovulum sediminis]|uniref:Nucleotidyltransferase family protein n=1 Tax=Catenovulum sediminis TaxID=1740262 RepID=A0ABV1REF8_9ALTE